MAGSNAKNPWRTNPLSHSSATRKDVSFNEHSHPTWSSHHTSISPLSPTPAIFGHSRNHSFSPQNSAPVLPGGTVARRRSHSLRNSLSSSITFAPKFIAAHEIQEGTARIDRIEGENDFSGKRYVWLADAEKTFVQGCVVEERANGTLLVECEDGAVCGAHFPSFPNTRLTGYLATRSRASNSGQSQPSEIR